METKKAHKILENWVKEGKLVAKILQGVRQDIEMTTEQEDFLHARIRSSCSPGIQMSDGQVTREAFEILLYIHSLAEQDTGEGGYIET